MGKVRLHFKIFGEVQGVGFRYHLRGAAKTLSLFGWAKNASDGTVEGEVEGEEGAVNKFLEEAKRGPDLGKVKRVEEAREGWRGEFHGFEVRS